MEICQEESLEHAPDEQQHQQQQQTTVENERRSPFLSPTTPVWGDRNVSTEETNNNFSFFSNLVSNTPDLSASTSSQSSSKDNSLTENNQSSIDAAQLPRKCKLCSYIAVERTEYIDHIIVHCTFTKSTYVENHYQLVNGYVEDEDLDDYSTELQGKGKKKLKNPKPKLCSKCEFVAKTKLVLWLHLRQHFMQEECSGFVCTLCPFATTLKHHMTFHWFSAHDDFKAFICTECPYSCVSKSMLTSHMKTHSEVYQFNCGSCTYRTKFCNAMKKHLKDSLHMPGLVLNPDGTRNPHATIDVYGNKRGPRRKPLFEKELSETEDRPSTSGIIPPVSTVSTSLASVSMSPTSSTVISDSPDSKDPRALKSPIRMSPTKIPQVRSIPIQTSYNLYNPLLANIQTESNRVLKKNRETENFNPDELFPMAFAQNSMIPTLRELMGHEMETRDVDDEEREKVFRFLQNAPNSTIYALHKLIMHEMETRNIEGEEREKLFRLFHNAQKFLLNLHDHLASATDANGDLSDDAQTDEPTSTNISEPSTSMIVDESSTFTTLTSEPQLRVEENGVPDEPLDLSMSAMSKVENQPEFQESVASSTSRRSKRKRKATKLEYFTVNNDETRTPKQTCVELSLPAFPTTSQSDLQTKNKTLNDVTHNANIYNSSFICYYCRIIFANEIMYAVHMSFHNAANPLTCALCDRKSANTTAFFLHLIRTKH